MLTQLNQLPYRVYFWATDPRTRRRSLLVGTLTLLLTGCRFPNSSDLSGGPALAAYGCSQVQEAVPYVLGLAFIAALLLALNWAVAQLGAGFVPQEMQQAAQKFLPNAAKFLLGIMILPPVIVAIYAGISSNSGFTCDLLGGGA